MLPMLTAMAALLAISLTATMAVTLHNLRLEHRFARARLSEKGGFSRG